LSATQSAWQALRRGAYLEGSPNVGKTLFQNFLAIVVV
jgi:hypothetical protein